MLGLNSLGVMIFLANLSPPSTARTAAATTDLPILEAPRELLARAWLPLMPAEAPPNALRFVALGVCDTCRLPTRFAPPPDSISLCLR